MYGKALFSDSVALSTRGSAWTQDVTVAGLVHAMMCVLKFFKIGIQLD